MQHRPNIVFIMADDHASKAVGCYGHGINHTPAIDRLAREGMRLNHCYVSNSICTPSRAAILTGTYNHVNGVMTLADGINNYAAYVGRPKIVSEMFINPIQSADGVTDEKVVLPPFAPRHVSRGYSQLR